MIDTYTRLLEVAAEHGDAAVSESAVSKLILHLKSAGRMKMLPQIVQELKKVAARRAALNSVFEVASVSEEPRAREEARALGITVSSAVVNPSLIKGWRAREGGKVVDYSAKQALISIYQNITH